VAALVLDRHGVYSRLCVPIGAHSIKRISLDEQKWHCRFNVATEAVCRSAVAAIPCGARAKEAPGNSLRGLWPLHSDNPGESVLEARFARPPWHCAPRRPRSRPASHRLILIAPLVACRSCGSWHANSGATKGWGGIWLGALLVLRSAASRWARAARINIKLAVVVRVQRPQAA
jgi:hypothetical protein